MCWNKDVSLNTFIFSIFVLLLILYNNKYTKYKIEEFSNFWIIMFYFVVALIQLIEYFIWINIDNPFYNKIFTMLAMLVLFFQPIVTIMNITTIKIKNILLLSYLFIFIPFSIYTLMDHKNIYSFVSQKGHLKWNILNNDSYNYIYNIICYSWIFFFLFPLFYQKYTSGFIFGILTLFFSVFNYLNDKTVGSMWCWIVNIFAIYYACYLLFYLPFIKK